MEDTMLYTGKIFSEIIWVVERMFVDLYWLGCIVKSFFRRKTQKLEQPPALSPTLQSAGEKYSRATPAQRQQMLASIKLSSNGSKHGLH
jgi:hypothetical protein